MPAKSQAQYRFMQMASASPSLAKKHGIPQSVAREYVAATKSPAKLPQRAKQK